MKIAVSTDEHTHLVDTIIAELQQRGHTVEFFGPPAGEEAKGARIWNHANVLSLSLRATSDALAKEILDAWFATPYSDDTWNRRQMERIQEIEQKYRRARP